MISAIIAVLVFISTLVTKQHVIVDVISAVIISEVVWWVVGRSKVYVPVWKVFESINNAVFGRFLKGKGN